MRELLTNANRAAIRGSGFECFAAELSPVCPECNDTAGMDGFEGRPE